jgi:hypothetical protein
MVRTNPQSIFKDVDLDNADSIRRIMFALEYYLRNRVLSQAALELQNMQYHERFVAGTILSTIRLHQDYPLLLEAILSFVEARNGDDQWVLAAARDMESLATGMVLTVPEAYPEEYAAAEALFKRTRAVDSVVAAHQDIQQRVRTLSHFPAFNSLMSCRLLAPLIHRSTAARIVQHSKS